ncbi:LysR family transcriptional regulator [Xylophilus sp.]|uniref:LysR family transcriptional regulator n=1 Tax=Xylophilus sp. TaxID=2653893 RepID=UPI0013BDA6E3|nr:LysR family transcriptional regulator [Xylophilus sp.]KAF1046540.1 MAG: HTH-type transcriptional activator CmpR [Xylophilus sp.]
MSDADRPWNPNITLRQLRVFQAVAQQRNFSGAGESIGLTQPAVSRSIRELEAQLGLKLLDRTTREVALTDAGRSLAGRLDRLLDDLELALLDLRGMATRRQGRVRVASSPTLSANLLPACIAACRTQAPGIEIVLLDRLQQDVLASVRSGEVDFGVVVEPGAAGDLHCEAILREPFVLVCPGDHALAQARAAAWPALADWPLVLLDHASGSRRLIDAALAAEGVAAEVAQEVGHVSTVFQMVAAGLGVAVVPALALPCLPAGATGLAVRPLAPQVERDVMLVHRRNRTLAPVVEQVWQLVRGVAAAMEPIAPAPAGG